MYDWLVGRPLRGFYAKLAKHFPPGKILDIGCGPGHLVAILHRHNRDVIGVDKDPTQVRIAKRNYPDIDVREGDAAKLPFADGQFDVVVTSESFHHWGEPQAGAAEAARLVGQSGRFIVIEGAGDVNKKEVAEFLGRRPFPGFATLVRWIFRVHGFTPTALETKALPILEGEFGKVHVQRRAGWWIITASEPRNHQAP